MARKKSTETASKSLSQAIRQCVDAGKVEFGANRGVKKALLGKAKLVVLSGNCPKDIAQDISGFCKMSGIPVLVFEGTSIELGTIVGRPHTVAVLSVLDEGNSTIMQFVK
ncbi:MAG: 50S ribosomal protein L30e [Candidatus Micrarchaeota archaeon]|nr:50S ribosomal protein L30e [Candidatus Micrarchaeota archaeon]